MLTSWMRTLWLWEAVACSDPRGPYVAELEREPASAGPKAFPVLLHVLFSLVLSWLFPTTFPIQTNSTCSLSNLPAGHQPLGTESPPLHQECAVSTPCTELPRQGRLPPWCRIGGVQGDRLHVSRISLLAHPTPQVVPVSNHCD